VIEGSDREGVDRVTRRAVSILELARVWIVRDVTSGAHRGAGLVREGHFVERGGGVARHALDAGV